jgi:hypothetical protein
VKKKYGESPEFLKTFNVSLQHTVANNIDKAYCGTAPRMSEVKECYSEAILKTWLMAQLCDLNDYCGVKQKINPRQIDEISELIMNQYSVLKVTEFMLFMTYMKSGFYGSFYGVIDPQAIMANLIEFNKNRMVEIARVKAKWESQEAERLREEHKKEIITREQYESLKQNQ